MELKSLKEEDHITLDDYGTITAAGQQDAVSLSPSGDDTTRILTDDQLAKMTDASGHMKRSSTATNCCMRDGQRQIDFVLVHEESIDTEQKKNELKRKEFEQHDKWRKKFMRNLQRIGVQCEEECVTHKKKKTHFVKIHVPWRTLSVYAEYLLLRAPLKVQQVPADSWSHRVISMCRLPNVMSIDVPNAPVHYYTCPFKTSKLSSFLNHDDPTSLFSTRDRQKVAYEILARVVYGKRKDGEIGIARLLEEKVFCAAFPLHDGPYKTDKEAANEVKGQRSRTDLNARQVLYEFWARWRRWYKYQPVHHIREYFGEKIGIYFVWLGFYTAWLLPAAVVGLLVFLFGLFTVGLNQAANETCESGTDLKMCPLCEICPYWNLSDVCVYTKAAYLFDHPGTVFYAVFTAFWAVTFLEYWKRKNASIAYNWSCYNMEEAEEHPRPEYAAKCTMMEANPVTGNVEPHFPQRQRTQRLVTGYAVIILMACVVLIFIIAIILYRILIAIPLYRGMEGISRSQASMIASVTASVFNLITILILGRVYEKLAYKLTQWEMYRTQSEFEDQLIFKVFIFQFVNFYSFIVYIGFFKGKLAGYPGHYTEIFGLRQEECDDKGGCLAELALQLSVIMIGKQIINNCNEVLIPKLKAFVHRWKIGKLENRVSKEVWEEDYELLENEGLFQEYLEMVLQFGFITIFVAAFPLAPLSALINNWIEVRVDANKFVCETRRPVAERCHDIGVWFTILEGLAQLAVISNAFLIAFTSEFLPKQLYMYKHDYSMVGYVNFTLAWAPNGTTTEPCRYKAFRDAEGNTTEFYWQLLCIRLVFVILFEHAVFGVCRLIDVVVPDIPQSLDLKIKRERYLAKQALADKGTVALLTGDQEEDEQDRTMARRQSTAVSLY